MLEKALILTVAAAVMALPLQAHAESQDPVDIFSWTPPFNEDLQRERAVFEPLKSADRPWRLCVSIPHLKDAYWLTVNFALVDEAKRLGVGLEVLEAGGYGNLALQREQIAKCRQRGADALIVGAISTSGLNDLIAEWTGEGIPVIDLINGVDAADITARSAVDFWDNGHQIGEYLRNLETGGSERNVLWLPGPEGSAWSAAADRGFRAAMAGANFRVHGPIWGDVSRQIQLRLIRDALKDNPEIDYVVGTAVSAQAAVEFVRESGDESEFKILSYYYSSVVDREIRRGRIVAAVTDKQGLQARMAVGLAVGALEGTLVQRHIAPLVEVVEKENVRSFQSATSLPPKGFRPILSVHGWMGEQ